MHGQLPVLEGRNSRQGGSGREPGLDGLPAAPSRQRYTLALRILRLDRMQDDGDGPPISVLVDDADDVLLAVLSCGHIPEL